MKVRVEFNDGKTFSHYALVVFKVGLNITFARYVVVHFFEMWVIQLLCAAAQSASLQQFTYLLDVQLFSFSISFIHRVKCRPL